MVTTVAGKLATNMVGSYMVALNKTIKVFVRVKLTIENVATNCIFSD